MPIDKSWYEKPSGIPTSVSAGGVVIRAQEEEIYLALVQEYDDNSAYVLPKGHVEPGETIEEAARREIAEEAGLTELTLVADLGSRERLSLRKKEWKQIHYFLFTTEQLEGTPSDRTLPYVLCWFNIRQLPAMFWPEQKELIISNLELIHPS